MDPYGLIYEDENPDPEDVARLDGYLKGRAESDAEKRSAREKVAEEYRKQFEAQFAKSLERRAGLPEDEA